MNRARGEVELLVDGEVRTLCLTLGALAELEAEFECQSLSDLQARLKQLSATELARVVSILLEAAGSPTDTARLSPGEAARAVAEAFHAALG